MIDVTAPSKSEGSNSVTRQSSSSEEGTRKANKINFDPSEKDVQSNDNIHDRLERQDQVIDLLDSDSGDDMADVVEVVQSVPRRKRRKMQ